MRRGIGGLNVRMLRERASKRASERESTNERERARARERETERARASERVRYIERVGLTGPETEGRILH